MNNLSTCIAILTLLIGSSIAEAHKSLEHFKTVATKTREAVDLLYPLKTKDRNALAAQTKLEEANAIYDSIENLPFSNDVIVALLYVAKDFPDSMCQATSNNPLDLSTQAMAFEVFDQAWHRKHPINVKRAPSRVSRNVVRASLIPNRGEVAEYTQEDFDDYLTEPSRLRSFHFHDNNIPRFPGLSDYPGYLDPDYKFIDGLPRPKKEEAQWWKPGPKVMLEVAELLQKSQLYDCAWRAYFEAMYGWRIHTSLHVTSIRMWGSYSGIFSVENAKHWHQAAQCAYLAGRKKLAWDLLLKAAVLGDEKCYKETQETATNWLSGKVTPESNALPETERRQALQKIVWYYQKLNMHPRAWKLVDQHRRDFNNPDELIQEIQKQWNERLDEYAVSYLMLSETYIYGQKAYKHPELNYHDGTKPLIRIKNPLEITVPWAMEDKAVQKVRQRIKELYKN